MQKKIKRMLNTNDNFRHFQILISVVFVVAIGSIFVYQMPRQNKAVAYTKNSFFNEGALSDESVSYFSVPDPVAEADYVEKLSQEKQRLEKDTETYLEMMEYYAEDPKRKEVYEKRKTRAENEIQEINFKIHALEQGAEE